MILPCKLSKGLALAAIFAALMLSACITSNDVLFNAFATPAKAGKYELQNYDGDGKWTRFAAGSLNLVNRRYRWTKNSELTSPFDSNLDGVEFTLVDIGNDNFIIVVVSDKLGNSIWGGNYRYGIARRVGDALLYDFPTCLDLLVSQGFADYQTEKIEAHKCSYSTKASLTSALTSYAKRAAIWKRLAPSGH